MCVLNRIPNQPLGRYLFRVVVGAHRVLARESSQRAYKVERMVVHEKYLGLDPKVEYDVMLIKVSPSIEYRDEVQPICLDDTVFPDNSTCVITGWGSTVTKGNVVMWFHVK